MHSIDELIRDVVEIKNDSQELANVTAAAGRSLQDKSNQIAAIVRGSASGQEAVMSVSVAARSLSQAAASMLTLSRICDSCIAELSK